MSILLSLFLACGAKQAVSTGPVVQNSSIPDWVMSSPFPEKVCAAGVYKFKGNIQMAFAGSADAARRELSKQLEIHVTDMFKTFIEEGTVEGEDFSESLSTNVAKSLVDETLNGTEPVRKEERNGNIWTLVCLDEEKFLGTFDKMKNVSEAKKKAIKNRARQGQAELREEIDALRKAKAQNAQ